jgi:hypothetical protein
MRRRFHSSNAPSSPMHSMQINHPHLLIKEASAATNQVRRSDYLDQDVCVHTDSALMRSLSGYLLFGHSATDPFNSGTLPSTDSGTGWHFLPECHNYSPLFITLTKCVTICRKPTRAARLPIGGYPLPPPIKSKRPTNKPGTLA